MLRSAQRLLVSLRDSIARRARCGVEYIARRGVVSCAGRGNLWPWNLANPPGERGDGTDNRFHQPYFTYVHFPANRDCKQWTNFDTDEFRKRSADSNIGLDERRLY